MTDSTVEQMSLFAQDTVYGRMSQGLIPQTKGATSKQSSRSLSASQSRKAPMCLCLTVDGHTRAFSWQKMDVGALRGEPMTCNFGEGRSDGAEYLWSPTTGALLPQKSCLSAILEPCADPKYRLSPTACQGILNRAERRGKELPEVLKTALEKVVATAAAGI